MSSEDERLSTETGQVQANLLQLESEVRGDDGLRCQAAEGARGAELEAQEAAGGGGVRTRRLTLRLPADACLGRNSAHTHVTKSIAARGAPTVC